MGKKQKLEQCKSLRDFKKYAEAQERAGRCTTTEGSNHFKVSTPKGSTFLSRGGQSDQLSKGFRSRLIAQFIGLGLGIWIIMQFI